MVAPKNLNYKYMLNRIRPISLSDRIQPIYMDEPVSIREITGTLPDRSIYDRPPLLIREPLPNIYNPEFNRLHPPALPVTKTAKYRFVDMKTGRLINNVIITRGLQGLGYTVNSKYGTGSFSIAETNKNYTAKAEDYNSIQFRPVAGRTTTVLMKKTVKTAQYKFVDGATGRIIPNIILTPYTGIKLPISKTTSLRGLGTPTLSNGVYTFPNSDINKLYTVKANNYNDTAVFVKDHSGVITIKLSQKSTVKFIDSATKQPIKGVKVVSGLSGLFGLGSSYRNTNGLFTFSFKPNEYSQKYTIKASGYKNKDIVITPSFGVRTIKLEQENIIIKQPILKTGNDDMARRLRLAKAKAKARIRKIKLLAI